jgi:hypothetical protein
MNVASRYKASCGPGGFLPCIVVVPSSRSQLAVGRRDEFPALLLPDSSWAVGDRRLTEPVTTVSDRSLEVLMRQRKPVCVSSCEVGC